MKTSDFDYHLPEELIASRPLEDRASSRMMLIQRETGEISHHHFGDLPDLLPPENLLVLGNSC